MSAFRRAAAAAIVKSLLAGHLIALCCHSAHGQELPDFKILKDRLVHAVLARNPARAAALFAQDAQLRSPMNIRAKGRKEIEGYFAGERFLTWFIMRQLDVRARPDGTVIDHGLFAKKYLIPEPIEYDGRYWIIWRRISDEWVIAFFYAEQDTIPTD
jgi:hypothetical protein